MSDRGTFTEQNDRGRDSLIAGAGPPTFKAGGWWKFRYYHSEAVALTLSGPGFHSAFRDSCGCDRPKSYLAAGRLTLTWRHRG